MVCPAIECATMLALCYPILISLALAAPGISRSCYIYCKSQQSESMKGAVPQECNCDGLIDSIIQIKELSTITLDDTGVYFVPAELDLFQEQFVSQPFFISNPANLIPKTRISRIYKEADTFKDNDDEGVDDLTPAQSAHVEIHKKTETISHTSINHEWGKPPLYLDLEIEESTDNARAAIQKNTLIQDFESTQETLAECLDFQVIHYTRKYGFIKEFVEFWKARNLKKYEHLSDLDIEAEMQKYCSESEAIVQHSLQEIKQGLPKKLSHSRSVQKNEDSVNKIKGETNINATSLADLAGADNSTSLTTSSPLYKLATEHYPVSENATEVYDSTYDPTEDWPFINATPTPILHEENTYELYQSSRPTTESSITMITTENTEVVNNPEKSINPVGPSKKVMERDAEHDLDTMASEDGSYTYSPATTIETKTSDDVQLSENSTTFSPTLSNPLSAEKSFGNESATTEINISHGRTLNDIVTPDISVTGAYSQVRNIYTEKEIEIPKIITKECQNNTVQITIDGNEELPNNDFIDSTTAQSEDFKTRTSKNNEIKYDITGTLFFVSERELVPVRFMQKGTGPISLGLDAAALCDKLVRKTNQTSHSMAALCDYLQRNQYSRK